jgi:hypothetical protein
MGVFTNHQFAAGINLATLATPMLRQATAVHAFTLKHNNVHYMRWRSLQVPFQSDNFAKAPEAMAALDSLESEIIARQRATAKPAPHHFEVVAVK